MSSQFEVGDRVKGLFAHQGKIGTVLEVPNRHWVVLCWDGGKRKSTVESGRLTHEDGLTYEQ